VVEDLDDMRAAQRGGERASRMKRASASGFVAICGSISLIATGDCSVRWCASHTDPMPPLPS